MRKVSVIISSHNYAPYLPQAMESALGQTWANTEVIVVDDGSIDASPQIIAGYGRRIVPILKENAGQASSLNAGYAVSHGEIVVFLDSDDVLLPHAVERAAAMLENSDVCKAHWHMIEIAADGRPTGRRIPLSTGPLARGDLRGELLAHGPRSGNNFWPPTSGNAWPRCVLEGLMPIPESKYITCPDLYLCALAPLYGSVARCDEPLSLWRSHGANNTFRDDFVMRTRRYVRMWEDCCEDLEARARSLGLLPDPAQWRRESWWHRIDQSLDELQRVLPPGAPFLLVDDDQWACTSIDGRRALPLVERDGQSWGEPADDASALDELQRQIGRGARSIVFAWPAFWWLDHYRGLADHLRMRARCTLQNERIIVFAFQEA
jgi:glycosyltransferase involved in cell wall biosynthesis